MALSLSRHPPRETALAAEPPAPTDLARQDELALVEAARTDPEAFGVLYHHFLPRIYGYLRLRCGSSEDASDLAQDVFVSAYAAMPRYRNHGQPFAPWLFAIARNRSADAARRIRAMPPALPILDPEDVPLDVSGGTGDGLISFDTSGVAGNPGTLGIRLAVRCAGAEHAVLDLRGPGTLTLTRASR